ncbi:hypothetical protein C1N53_12955 [Pontibacter sp. SGAir0037]|nr:hypothetical protein C1N53_12955 [Pontibacter sp. SGAir0037]
MKLFKFLPMLFVRVGIAFLDSCSPRQTNDMTASTAERPREAWVLRSVWNCNSLLKAFFMQRSFVDIILPRPVKGSGSPKPYAPFSVSGRPSAYFVVELQGLVLLVKRER